MKYLIQRWWLKRQLALVAHRREELAQIVARERSMLDHEEAVYNRKLRELQSNYLHSRLATKGI